MNQFSTSNSENELTSNREKTLNFEIIPPKKTKKRQMNMGSSHEIFKKVEDGKIVN